MSFLCSSMVGTLARTVRDWWFDSPQRNVNFLSELHLDLRLVIRAFVLRPRRRPNARWIDDIRKVDGVNWKAKAIDPAEWKNLEVIFIQQWIENGC